MAKDTDFANDIDSMPYDEYISQRKAANEADAQTQTEKAKDGPAQYNVDKEGGYQAESFDDEGGYDDYLSESGSSSLSGDDSSGGASDAEDGTMTGSANKTKSSETPSEANVDVLAGGKGTGTEMQAASAGQAISGVGSKIADSIKGAGLGFLNGLKNMFRKMGGSVGQLAETLHVSIKVAYIGLALFGGGGATFLGITFFGDDGLGRVEPQRDCRVEAVVTYQYTNNEIYTPMTQSAMDGNAKSIYRALSSKDLIDGIIGFEYTVGDKDTDPYYDERALYYVDPSGADHPEYYKYLGRIETDGYTDLDGIPVPHDTWMFDINMGKKMWSHGPATLLDTVPGNKTGVLNVIPGNGARVSGTEDPDVSNRIGAGTLPGLTDQRIQPHVGFTDEAILGMILNAERESNINPGCWEADYLCYYYIKEEGIHNTSRNVVLATTHHRNWNTYVLELYNVYDGGINLSAYAYQGVDSMTEELDGQTLYYPGIGLWQWTGARAYAMEQWNNMLMNVKDSSLDTANDTLYSMTSQIYYVLFENLGNWKGDLNHPKDFAGFERYALDVNGNRIEETRPDPVYDPMKRVSLIDWGITPRVTYTETYYVNIPNRPNAEKLYGRERLAIHSFSSVRTLNQATDAVKDNHDNLVRPQFDYVYGLDNLSGTYKEIDLTDNNDGKMLRLVNVNKIGQLYELMITSDKRPDCTCSACAECDPGTWADLEDEDVHEPDEDDSCECGQCSSDCSCAEEECDCVDEETGEANCSGDDCSCGCNNTCDGSSCSDCSHTCDCDPVTASPPNTYVDGCVPKECSPDAWCWHQCELDNITNIRTMIDKLMQDYRDKDGNIWWHGLKEADFLDVGEHHTATYSCGDNMYENLKGTSKENMLNASNNLSVYYVKWYYDMSVEVAAYQGGTLMHDVDNMSRTSGGVNGERNGNADRPDVTSYANSGKSGALQAGDQIIYESTSEAVCGYVSGREVFTDEADSHPGTNTYTEGYSQQSHGAAQGGWMLGAIDEVPREGDANLTRHFYMYRTKDSDDSSQWSNYGKYPVTWNGNIGPIDAQFDYDTDWIGWNQEVFEKWWGENDTTAGVHGCKTTYSPLTGSELIDRYYRLRLAAYSGDIISPATGSEAVFGSNDGSLAQGGGLRASWEGSGATAYPKQPVEPTIDDLTSGDGGGLNGGATDWDTGIIMGGGDDYTFVRTISDNLMWWAESRAIAQVARVTAREFTVIWEGMDIASFRNNHSKFGSAVHYAFKMLSDTWGSDNKGSSSILDLWYENMSTAPVQTWWQSFYRNYCDTGTASFGGIAECATSWAWLQGHESTATVHDTSLRLSGGQYKKTYCTQLYVAVKDLMEPIPTAEGMTGLYSSCDRGVCTAVHASGADDSFPWGAAVGQYDYAMSSGKWEDLGAVSAGSFDMLEPGDLLLSPHHVIVFVGGEYAAKKWPGEVSETTGQYGVVHSSLSANISNSRGPRYDPDGRSCVSSGDFHAFRLVGEPDESSACKAALKAAESSLAGLDDGSF